MKNILKSIIISFIVLGSFQCNAQDDLIVLQNKDWAYQEPPKLLFSVNGATELPASTKIVIGKFTSTKMQIFINGTLSKVFDYYLSENFIHWNNFDSEKIGTVLNGEYLITPTKTYLIRELTDNKLEIVPFFIYRGDMILSTTESTFLKN